MPKPYGGDLVEPLDRGRYRIVSPRPKGWRSARAATRTSAEFPGTAVAWDGALWEVVSADERDGSSSRYVLAPWRDKHAIRLTVDYDAASERAIAAEAARSATRSRGSAGIVAAGLVVGLLPAHVQKEIESEYGFSATRLTLLSLLPQLALAAIGAAGLPIADLPGPRWPAWFLFAAALAGLQVAVRSWYCLLRSLPLGSVEGLLVWHLLAAVSPRARRFETTARRTERRQRSVVSAKAPDQWELERDEFTQREPFLALLAPEDQMRLAATFGFDWLAWGRRSAATVALLSGAGVATALAKLDAGTATSSTWVSLLLAALVFAEQMKRFAILSRGKPAGSLLGIFVLPFCRKLLALEPRALAKGTTQKLERPLPAVWDGDAGDDDQTGR